MTIESDVDAAAKYAMAQGWAACAARVEAATRMVAPDEITPMGARIINKAASDNPYRGGE